MSCRGLRWDLTSSWSTEKWSGSYEVEEIVSSQSKSAWNNLRVFTCYVMQRLTLSYSVPYPTSCIASILGLLKKKKKYWVSISKWWSIQKYSIVNYIYIPILSILNILKKLNVSSMIKSKPKGQGKRHRLIGKSLAFRLLTVLSKIYFYYNVGFEFCGWMIK